MSGDYRAWGGAGTGEPSASNGVNVHSGPSCQQHFTLCSFFIIIFRNKAFISLELDTCSQTAHEGKNRCEFSVRTWTFGAPAAAVVVTVSAILFLGSIPKWRCAEKLVSYTAQPGTRTRPTPAPCSVHM